jgi:hypothetical protein
MFTLTRRLRATAASAAATALVATGLLATAPAAHAVAGHPAGIVGNQITIATVQSFAGYDVAANAAGTAYIGWISTTASDTARKVHLCKLPLGASSCSGGVQTIDSLGISSAAGLQVLLTADGVVHLIWFHDTANSINGPQGSAIAEATAPNGANLSAAHDVVTDAPSFGQLLTAVRGPNGSIWTVTYAGVPTQQVQVRAGLTSPATAVHTPYGVSYAQLAFASGKPVLAVEKYGAISTGPSYATRSSGGSWSSFHAVANTWAVGTNVALAATRHGVRLVTAINNASYHPVISKWTGTGFTARARTADGSPCTPVGHDGWADASGRLLDVSWECGKVTIANYADAFHAAIVRFSVSNTATFTPQIASGTRGIATVAYSNQQPTGTNQVLRVARVRLPDSTYTVAKSGTGGRVTVTGPRSCLPPVNVHIGWTHKPASGWSFKSGSFRLGTKTISSSTLDGATLTAGKQYTLHAAAVFGRNGTRDAVRASLSFTTCATG